MSRHFGVGRRHAVTRLNGREEGAEPVVIALENRVELVVVTARTLHAHAEEDVARGIRQIVENSVPLAARIAGVPLVDAVAQVAGGNDGLRFLRKKFVARELLLDEAGVGLVGIERADDVVAKAPRVGPIIVRAIAVAVGVAHEVKPVPRHALAVMRAGQQSIHNPLIRIRCGVSDKGTHFRRCGRQADEIEGHSANKHRAAGFGRWREIFLLQPRHDEAVHVISDFRFWILDFRRHAGFHRLEGPPLPILVSNLSLCPPLHARRFATFFRLRPRSAGLDPLRQRSDIRVCELALLGRHLQIRITIAHRLEHQTFLRLASHHGRSCVAARQCRLA